MSQIPLSALAGVLLVTAWRMNEHEAIKQMFSRKIKTSIAQYLITMVATVVFDLTVAILIGILFSMIMFIIKSHKIAIEIDPVKSAKRSTVVVYVDGSLFFGSQDQLTKTTHKLMDEGVKHIIFSLRGVPNIDHSSIEEFFEIQQMLKEKKIRLWFCGMQAPVQSMMQRLGFIETVGEENIYPSAVVAIQALR